MPNTKTSKAAANTPAEEPEPKKAVAVSKDATHAVGNEALAMEISQHVTEKISAMMEKKFRDLSATLDNITTRLESNTKRTTCRPWSPG